MEWKKKTERLQVAPGFAVKRTCTNRWGVFRATTTPRGKLRMNTVWPILVRSTLAEAKAAAEALAREES